MMNLLIVTKVLLIAGIASANSVKVSIYYESLCPDSVRFIVNQLYPTYYNVSSAIEVDFVPYGKANHTLVDGTWQFECQHGEQECFGNKYQACVLAQNYTQDINVEFITCIMGASSPAAFQTIYNCANQLSVAFDPINQCFNDEGDNLLAALGDRTHATQNTQVFVPTITYNDVFSQDLQDESLTNFAGVVCSQAAVDQLVDFCERDNTNDDDENDDDSDNAQENSANSLMVVNGLLVLFTFVTLVNQW